MNWFGAHSSYVFLFLMYFHFVWRLPVILGLVFIQFHAILWIVFTHSHSLTNIVKKWRGKQRQLQFNWVSCVVAWILFVYSKLTNDTNAELHCALISVAKCHFSCFLCLKNNERRLTWINAKQIIFFFVWKNVTLVLSLFVKWAPDALLFYSVFVLDMALLLNSSI